MQHPIENSKTVEDHQSSMQSNPFLKKFNFTGETKGFLHANLAL
jgi:hypothetical protein